MKKIKMVLMILGLISVPEIFIAGSGDYGLAGEYLLYDVGARAAGMGGAMTGLADDVTAAFYNPAGLAAQNPIQIGLQHVQLFEDTLFDFAGLTLPLPGIGALGVSAIALSSFGFDVRDDNYNPLNIPDNLYQGALYISYARDITPDLFCGGNVKVVHENLFGNQGTGIGIDLGALYRPIPELQIGLYAYNILPPQVLDERYAGGITIGLAGKLLDEKVLLAADIGRSFDNQDIHWKAGGQVDVYSQMAFVRAGLDDELRVFAGVGGKYENITLDYSAGIEALGWSHKISLGYAFGGFQVNIQAHPKLFSPVGIKRTTSFAIHANTKYPSNDWELRIIDQNGDVVRTFAGEEQPPNQIVWNGKDDRGLMVPDGNFCVQLQIIDINGNVLKSNTDSVKIQSAIALANQENLNLE